MAKKADEPLTRVMKKQLPALKIGIADGDLATNPAVTDLTGYTVSDSLAGFTCYRENDYFDLSGYNMRDMTVFFQGALLQQVGNYDLQSLETDAYPIELRIISTVPMNDEILSNLSDETKPPGSLDSNFSLDQIVLAERFIFGQDVGAEIGRIMDGQAWGTGTATAAQKLFVSRYFFFPRVLNAGGNANYAFQAPDLAFVVPMVASKEPEFEYFMRLSRSLEPVY